MQTYCASTKSEYAYDVGSESRANELIELYKQRDKADGNDDIIYHVHKIVKGKAPHQFLTGFGISIQWPNGRIGYITELF